MNQKHTQSPIRHIIAYIPVTLYIISAGILAIIAAALLFEGVETTVSALTTGRITETTAEIYSIFFHAATAIALLESVQIFIVEHKFASEMLLLAGVAEIIRHILIFDLQNLSEGNILTSGLLLGIFIIGILVIQILKQRNAKKKPKRRQRTDYQHRAISIKAGIIKLFS
jgi:hypothetical protein